MGATRNNTNLSFGQVAITPVVSVVAPVATTPTGNTSPSQQIATVAPVAITNINPATVINAPVATIINPLAALQGTFFLPAPNPVSIPSNNVSFDEQKKLPREPTLPLENFQRRNGITIRTTANIRPDLLATTNYKPIYQTSNTGYTDFGVYLSDLYKASTLRDTLRRYVLASQNQQSLGPILTAINSNIRTSLNETQTTVSILDQLVTKFTEVKSVLNVKSVLGSERTTEPIAPLLKLPQFFTNRMLFSGEAYNSFADTKLMYQLIADLSNIISLCSFNLLDNFQDLERKQSPVNALPGSVVDPITIDKTYGTSLNYTPSSISRVYVRSYTDYNNILNALPVENGNRIKFLINLLSKEFRVSYGLGIPDLLTNEITFFGFGDSGDPFVSVNGVVPTDIFVSPNGVNSLSSLFYQKIEGNAVVLPFEARQVSGDGETIFVPGSEYFGDGILNNNPVNYQSYRDNFSTVYTNARSVYDKLLLEQSTKNLSQNNLLKTAALLFQGCQSQFRNNGTNSDSTSLLIYSLFLLGIGNTRLKYETYKLLLLLILYTERNVNRVTTVTINQYRDFIFRELSNLGTNPITETNIDSLFAAQVNLVKELFEKAILASPNLNNTNATQTNYLRSNISVALEQFTTLGDALKDSRCGPNLFKSVNSFAKLLFNECSLNNESLHLAVGSTTTRFNGLSMTGMILLSYEIFSGFVQQFSTDVVLNTQVKNTQVSDLNIEFRIDVQTINDFLNETGSNTNILNSFANKLQAEDEIIKNILEFFKLINSGFSQISIPTKINLSQLETLSVENISLGYIRTVKNSLRSIMDKMAATNSKNLKGFEFYLPSGKYVSTSNWYATTIALQDPKLRSLTKQKILSIGVPKGFLDAALGARLSRNAVVGNVLNIEPSDVVNVKIYKTSKNDDGLIFDPLSFKFDLSLFPYGFDGVFPLKNNAPSSNDTYQSLLAKFKFYDFDESIFTKITPSTLDKLLQTSFYKTRRSLGEEVLKNLYTSFILENYLNVLTGLSVTEDTFIEYSQQEIETFSKAMEEYQSGNQLALGITKFMSNPYQSLLNYFANPDEKKLMLTLCNDVSKTVLRQKLYDRVFHVVFDSKSFPININATRKNPMGAKYLENLQTTNQIEIINGLSYRKSEDLDISQYFINVEIIN